MIKKKISNDELRIIVIIFGVSLVVNIFVHREHASKVIDTIAFNIMPVLIGLAIHLHGIIVHILAKHYSKIPEGKDGKCLRDKLKNIVDEIKENSLFMIGSYFAVLLCILLRGLDSNLFSNINLNQYIMPLSMNILALTFIGLSCFALYDTTSSILDLQLALFHED